ncbi:potassium/sodium hyperpolarization-activated cyclic nucleotide-gated channel 4-like [Culicoides brevitarsis]|uniref:potassium/sodium hyperpolarization-activated cyclic nucleotide-gated channel 4-like n=1 Tax=Culicoides brevitarsis TaxID=469753 RepID=UPI00307B8128
MLNNRSQLVINTSKTNIDHVTCTSEVRPNPIHRRFRNPILAWIYSQITANESHPTTRWYLKSRKAIYNEVQRHVESDNWFIVHPFSNFSSAYHIDLTRCINCDCYYIDYAVFNTIISLEIIVTFFLGYHTQTEIVLEQAAIAKHYIKSYFFFDMVSCLPVTYLINFSDINNEKSKIYFLHDLALLRIVTAPRFFKFLNITADFFKISDFKRRVIRLACFCVLFMHFTVCLYKRIYAEFFQDSTSDFAQVMFDPRVSALERYFMVTYILSWRIFGANFGNIHETMLLEKMLGLVSMLVFFCFYIFLLIQILYIMETKDVSRQKYQEIMRQVDHYMGLRQFPLRLQKRVRLFYEKKFMKTYFKEDLILEALSEPLRQDIVLHCGNIFIKKVKLLEGIRVSIIKSIVSCLQLEIFLPNDPVTKAGEYGFCMYFIGVGTLAVYTKSGREVTHLEDGDHFGEFCLLFPERKRKGSVIAVDYSEIYRLDIHDFQKTIQNDPEIFARLESLATRRLDMILIEEERHKQSWTENN